MGVDYYICEFCGSNFPDCREFFPCYCGKIFCSKDCGGWRPSEKPENEEEYTSCVFCRTERITNNDLLSFVLKKFNITYDEAVEFYKKSHNK